MNYCNRIGVTKDCHIYINDGELKEEFVYVYILQNNYTKEIQLLIKETNDVTVFNFTDDGYYTLCTLEVSTNPTSVYYYRNGDFYRNVEKVDIQELIESNKVKTYYQEYFNICRLKKCYINLCQEIFDKRGSVNCNSTSVTDTYKRDLVWATINVIEYMVEMDQYSEAQRLLLRVTGCNGICDNYSNNCSCGQM